MARKKKPVIEAVDIAIGEDKILDVKIIETDEEIKDPNIIRLEETTRMMEKEISINLMFRTVDFGDEYGEDLLMGSADDATKSIVDHLKTILKDYFHMTPEQISNCLSVQSVRAYEDR